MEIDMKKAMTVFAVVSLSTMLLAGCENMSSNDKRVASAALGGAIGGGVGNNVGGGTGATLGGGAGAAIGSKTQNGSNRNATYSGVGGAIGSAIGKGVFGGNAGAAIGGAIGGILGWIGGEKISKALESVGTFFKGVFTKTMEGLKKAWGKTKEFAKSHNIENGQWITIPSDQTVLTGEIDLIIERVNNGEKISF